MYVYIMPPMQQALRALGNILTKAEAHCTEHKIDPNVILQFRLFPDMLNFTKQVQLTCDFAARTAPRLCGLEMPSFPDTETSFAELQTRVAAAAVYLAGYEAAQFEGAETRIILLKLPSREVEMSGLEYGMSFAIPQVFFHLTTVYDILRHNGVVLGKRDYMGV